MFKKTHKNGNQKEGWEEIRYPLPAGHPSSPVHTDGKFIDPENLNFAQAEQICTNNLLNDVLVYFKELDRVERNVTRKNDFATFENVLRAAADNHRMLGELLQASYSIRSDQLNAAIEEQKRTGGKLGEALVRLGFLDQRELDAALSFQCVLDEENIPSWLSLEKLLISAGYITDELLNDALERQLRSGKNLAEILVDAGHVQQHHIEHGLYIQKYLVGAILMAALSLAPIEEATSASQSSLAMSTNIQVTARVLAWASMHILQQPAQIVVTDADITRGYLDVSAGTLVEISNNTRAGVSITFEAQGLPFKEALVSGLGREVALGPNGGIVTNQITGTNIVTLNYRFVFDENSQAGTYVWPLSLSVSPVE